jgi:glycosyltransferase involved in cell wall biosynthesis
MKICIIAGTFFPMSGGVQIEINNIANILNSKGYKTDIFVFKKIKLKNKLYQIFKIDYFYLSVIYLLKKVFNINISKIFSFFNINLINLDYDIYHFHFLTFKSLILIDYLKHHNKKIVATFHGADIQIKKEINYGFRLNKSFDEYLKKIIKKIDGFQCISKNIHKDMINLNIDDKKIYKIPNSIVLKNKIIKKKYEPFINLITVGRFAIKKKGYDLIPLLTKKLIKEKINFKWKIIGENTNKIYENDLTYKNKDKIIAIDNILGKDQLYLPSSKLTKYYEEANLYINLSRIESFGLTFIESLASCTPILSRKSKGIDEIIINKKNGFFIKDMNDFVKKIKYLQKNKDVLKKVSLNGRKSVQRFNINKNSNKIINFYNKII